MIKRNPADILSSECREQFIALVECVGIKKFSQALGISTRQVNRILSGAQPNPIERLITCLQAADPDVGDCCMDFICQEMGGHFVRQEGLDSATVNAVRECAEAIAAISDGQVSEMDVRDIREAISALSGLIHALKQVHGDGKA